MLTLIMATLFAIVIYSTPSANYKGFLNNPKEPLQNTGNSATKNSLVANWNQSSQIIVDETIIKYGQPNGVNATELIWTNTPITPKISSTKTESKQNFFIKDTGMMQTTIKYKAPRGKVAELEIFDGNNSIQKTTGLTKVEPTAVAQKNNPNK